MWLPELEARTGPRYLAIADALADDISQGRLTAGIRLPTHRDLAEALGVTVGTVSRAYGEARARGLVVGEVGRGTFVRGPTPVPDAPSLAIPESPDLGTIDLSLNFMRSERSSSLIPESLRELADDPSAVSLLEEYRPQPGALRHREAGAEWIARGGLSVTPDRVLLCAGAQHAMTVALLGLTRPGDGLLTGSLTYPAITALARTLHLELHGIEMDEHGLVPEALESACRAHKPRALYCMPNLQNPTTRLMPLARREAIAEVAARHGLAVVEDDAYGFLLEDPPPPIATLYEHRTYHLTSCSKALSPGLRVGWLALPPGDRSRFVEALWATTVMAPALMAELATRWIASGAAEALIDDRRREARARQAIARTCLSEHRYESHPESLQVWLQLPATMRPGEIVARAQRRGVAVTSGEAFAVGSAAPSRAIRVALGGARTHERLRTGLSILDELLRTGAPACVV